MKSITTCLLALLIASPLCFTGCGGSSSSTKEESGLSDKEKTIATDIHQVVSDLPAPSVLPNALKSIGSLFDRALMNDFSNLQKYRSNEDKVALNLGVYISDVGYSAAYQNVDLAFQYMDTIQVMANSLGLPTGFDENLKVQYRNSSQNADSLTRVVNEEILLTEHKLEATDHLTMAGLVLTGSFVEGLHQVVSIVEDYHEGTKEEQVKTLQPLVQIILDLEKPLKDVIKLMQDIPHDDTIRRMLNELEILELLYQGDLKRINEAMEKEGENFMITPEMMSDVIAEVKRIRREIVE